MDPKRCAKCTLTELLNELYFLAPEETSDYRYILEELLDIITITGATENNSHVEIETSEQDKTLVGFTIWTDDTIITTSRWPWSPSEKIYMPHSQAIHVIPVTPWKESEFEYAPKSEILEKGKTKSIEEIRKEINDL